MSLANSVFTGALFLGGSLSNISLVLIEKFGWRVTYLIGGLYGVLAGILVLLFMRE